MSASAPKLSYMARPPDFSSTWAKIEWAKYHRDVLNSGIDTHFVRKANKPRAIGKYEPDAACHVFRVTSVPANLSSLMSDVSLTVGDIVHSLRSALDHLAYQLALAEARRRKSVLSVAERRNVYFPIHTRRRGTYPNFGWKNREHAYVGRFGKDNVAILKRYQPYRGRAGDPDIVGVWHPLTLLHQLANRDKHRLLVVVAAAPDRFQTGIPPAGVHMWATGHRRVELGAEFARATFPADYLEVEVDTEITPTISLPKRGSVISAVDRISAFVVKIVSEFDPLT